MQSISSLNVIDLLLDAVCIVDEDSRIVFVSPAFERIFGYTPQEAVGLRMLDLVHPEDLQATEQQAQRVMGGSPQLQFENRYVRKDGAVAHILWTAQWLPERRLRLAVAHDITKRKHTESMHAAIYAISEAAHAAPNLPTLFERIHRIIGGLMAVAQFTVALHDRARGALSFPYLAPALEQNPHSTPGAGQIQLCTRVIQEDRPLRLSTCEGPQTCHWLGVPLPAQDGAMGALLLQGPAEGDTYSEADKELLQFVSTQVALAIERTQMHERLQHMAQYDQLTALPNRALFNDRLRIAMARAHREQTLLSLLFIDLDRFKEVNDTLGHAMGDLLLQGVAQRLQACVRGSDTVARLGGDEFVVLLEGIHAGELPQPVAQKILTAFAQPFDLNGLALSIQPSIGMAVFPEHGTHESMLLSHADEAMYQAKRNGGNQFIVHPRGAATRQGLSGSA
ncbi:sensor domain-containing diguanylate cyclase [Acidovorax sp. 1608163]|uniref:sensor domain-containing protein n=1 Tax=Acidovorax sp. 1608163 TaxID=2478662 RepID=UPI000EF646EA|nr:diguanylate cyclase [Acidovorax sp. 1608163]AYM96158.1 sensor domain-containing diguanylate cyclase [Acidovorax sp. 1608163]